MAKSTKASAGLLMFRRTGRGLEVLLVHPGGPFWAKKDAGAWSVPKGEFDPGEDPLAAARREFAEETGFEPPAGGFLALDSVQQPGGKVVHAWAFAGDCDPAAMRSNTFEMEWPPRSGRRQAFPEADRAAWYRPAEALAAILPGQRPLIERLVERLGDAEPTARA